MAVFWETKEAGGGPLGDGVPKFRSIEYAITARPCYPMNTGR